MTIWNNFSNQKSCFLCVGETVKEHDNDVYNMALDDFSNALLKQEKITKSVIRRLTEQLRKSTL